MPPHSNFSQLGGILIENENVSLSKHKVKSVKTDANNAPRISAKLRCTHFSLHEAMAPLLCFELLCCIADHSDKQSLAIVARSSRALHEAAITSLWSSLNNIMVLIKLFPDDAFDLKDGRIVSLYTRDLKSCSMYANEPFCITQ
jgi:hypothetical protein